MSENRYILSADIEPVAIGDSFESLPLHVTLVHWFSLGVANIDDVRGVCNSTIESSEYLTTIATERALFGPSHDIPVMRLHKTSELSRVHQRVVDGLGLVGVRFLGRPEWIGEGWNPHVTDTSSDKLAVGGRVELDTVHLFENRIHQPDKLAIEELRFLRPSN